MLFVLLETGTEGSRGFVTRGKLLLTSHSKLCFSRLKTLLGFQRGSEIKGIKATTCLSAVSG